MLLLPWDITLAIVVAVAKVGPIQILSRQIDNPTRRSVSTVSTLPSSDLILPGLTCSCYRPLFQVFICDQRVGLNELRTRVAFEEPVAAHKRRSELPFITQRPSRWLCRCSFFLSALSFDMRRFALSYTATRRLQCSLSISPTAPMQTDGRPSPLLSAQASEHRHKREVTQTCTWLKRK